MKGNEKVIEHLNQVLKNETLNLSSEQMLSATWERIVQDMHFGSVHFETVS